MHRFKNAAQSASIVTGRRHLLQSGTYSAGPSAGTASAGGMEKATAGGR